MRMSLPAARASLQISGRVRIEGGGTPWEVAIVRVGEWQGSLYLSPYVTMLLLSRLWRWIRRERRWRVVLSRVDAVGSDGEVCAEVNSRDEAIERAMEVVARLQTPTQGS